MGKPRYWVNTRRYPHVTHIEGCRFCVPSSKGPAWRGPYHDFAAAVDRMSEGKFCPHCFSEQTLEVLWPSGMALSAR